MLHKIKEREKKIDTPKVYSSGIALFKFTPRQTIKENLSKKKKFYFKIAKFDNFEIATGYFAYKIPVI